MTTTDFLTPADAGRVLGVTAAQVRHLALQGRLREFRASSNRRLYKAADVECLREQRAAERAQRAEAAGAQS